MVDKSYEHLMSPTFVRQVSAYVFRAIQLNTNSLEIVPDKEDIKVVYQIRRNVEDTTQIFPRNIYKKLGDGIDSLYSLSQRGNGSVILKVRGSVFKIAVVAREHEYGRGLELMFEEQDSKR